MPFPKTADEAVKKGYKLVAAGRCKGCGVSIEWYETPNGKMMPIVDPQKFTPHWADCPNKDQFRN